jgi:hypothetical protein
MTIDPHTLLGAIADPSMLTKNRWVNEGTRDWLIVFGAITVLTGLLVLVVYLLRGKKEGTSGERRHRRHRRHHHSGSSGHSHSSHNSGNAQEGADSGGDDDDASPKRRKWRRRRREHRPRNPTLAETGGLPPVRPEGPPPSP